MRYHRPNKSLAPMSAARGVLCGFVALRAALMAQLFRWRQMRVIAFIVFIGVLLSGCASNRAEVSVSLTSTQPLYRPLPSSREQTYLEALVKGEIHDALNIADTVLRRRGFELLSENVPGLWPIRREYT